MEHGHGRGYRYRYADAGTQYSPEGYPPTAGYKQAIGRQKLPGRMSNNGKKRKESASMDSPGAMSTSGAPSSSGSASTIPSQPPPEPELRVVPSNDQVASSSRQQAPTNTQQNHVQPPSEPEAEPQEARSTHGHSSAPKRAKSDTGAAKVMPRIYENCNPKDLGVLISSMLMELIRLNDKIPLRDGRLTRFHSRAPPGISVSDYLQRLIQHATLVPPILLSMVYYIDRLCALYPAFTINSLTVHRFLITAATVAAKGLSDSFWTNPTYARIGGIPVSELATLELEFLQKVQWKIVPKPEVLEDYYASLVERTEGYILDGSKDNDSSSGEISLDGSQEDGEEDDKMIDEPT